MKILVTGAGGMLAKTLIPRLQRRGHEICALTKEELDITDAAKVISTFKDLPLKAEIVLHCAAYTKVDQAESEIEEAMAVNGTGTANVARAAAQPDIPMLYVSTDYVFDGTGKEPYKPEDKTNPISVYGKSKLMGERAVLDNLSRFYIVRTSWLYGPHGRNFVDTIEKLAQERDELQVVADQLGSPTSTLTLSEIIADLIETGRWGIYHASDEGITSWHEFARAIVKGIGRDNVNIKAITTADMPRPAPRPAYSGLDKTSLKAAIGRELTPWQDALAQYQSLKRAQETGSEKTGTASLSAH